MHLRRERKSGEDNLGWVVNSKFRRKQNKEYKTKMKALTLEVIIGTYQYYLFLLELQEVHP